MSHQVHCSNPQIILNPSLRDLILKYRNVTIRGKLHRFSDRFLDLYSLPSFIPRPRIKELYVGPEKDPAIEGCKRLEDYVPTSSINPENIFSSITTSCNVSKDDLENCFVTDFVTSEVFPVYIEVPCGKCDLCKESKINSFVERCKMESQCYDSKPWFVTLTYSDDNLPLTGVRVRDVQLFLKRFRINLIRSGYDFKLRYCAVGEYGKGNVNGNRLSTDNGFCRPHYHLIIWGLDVFDSLDFDKVSNIMCGSWKLGFIKHRLVDPSDDKCFYYTAKYLLKENFVPLYTAPDGKQYPCNNFFCFSHDLMEV